MSKWVRLSIVTQSKVSYTQIFREGAILLIAMVHVLISETASGGLQVDLSYIIQITFE